MTITTTVSRRRVQIGSDMMTSTTTDTSHASMSEASITTALQLLQMAGDCITVANQNADLIDQDAGTGALDAVIAALERGDVPCALERLDAAVLLADQPLAPPTTGHAIKQRASLLKVAKSCHKLMRLGIKATGGAA